jgi:hypothetical protein
MIRPISQLLKQKEVDFTAGELNGLLKVGTEDIEQQRVYSGEEVFEEIKRLSVMRRRAHPRA